MYRRITQSTLRGAGEETDREWGGREGKKEKVREIQRDIERKGERE